MEQETKQNKNLILIIVILGIGCLLIVSIYVVKVGLLKNKQRIVEEEKAMLNVELLGLFENLYDSSEMFFDYRVDNYGNVEAKNVKVRCKILNKMGDVESSVLDNFGSIASNSAKVGEVVTLNIPFSQYEDGTYFCYVESCENCEILYRNIPDMIEFYDF